MREGQGWERGFESSSCIRNGFPVLVERMTTSIGVCSAKLNLLPALWPGSVDAYMKTIVFSSGAECPYPNEIVACRLEVDIIGKNRHFARLVYEVDSCSELIGVCSSCVGKDLKVRLAVGSGGVIAIAIHDVQPAIAFRNPVPSSRRGKGLGCVVFS